MRSIVGELRAHTGSPWFVSVARGWEDCNDCGAKLMKGMRVISCVDGQGEIIDRCTKCAVGLADELNALGLEKLGAKAGATAGQTNGDG